VTEIWIEYFTADGNWVDYIGSKHLIPTGLTSADTQFTIKRIKLPQPLITSSIKIYFSDFNSETNKYYDGSKGARLDLTLREVNE
jgi:hypothetical protein